MKIGILGLGLIGGSLGFDLRSHGHYVLGVSRRLSTCETAMTIGCVDEAGLDMNLLAMMDVVFICTPIGLIVPKFAELINYVSTSCIITDVGSVKTSIVQGIAPHWQNFIGGHPMAGRADSGVEAAQRNLFVDKPYVLTPTATTPKYVIEVMEGLVSQLGSKIYHCSPQDHDLAVSWISHLPVMVSSSLIAACMGQKDGQVLELAQNLASSGFRDTSRVGGGNPELGLMMAQYNRQALLASLQKYRAQIDDTINAIEQEDWQALEEKLSFTQQVRPLFTE